MNVRMIGAAPVSLAWALRLSWLGWGAVGVEALLVDILGYKAFAALVGSAIVTSVYAGLKHHAQEIKKALGEHAGRMEEITNAHAEIIAKQVLTIERFFKMGTRSDDAARRDAADVRVRDESGPFKAFRPVR
ncbi:hypothetical protein ACLQ2R_17715 [Streptosporangium sp. DT93]|uniref:hypothetical protein n=1 Tax=Streptosporangium sp. DT93 TaxID=3393428 RepID=UPI003CF5045F